MVVVVLIMTFIKYKISRIMGDGDFILMTAVWITTCIVTCKNETLTHTAKCKWM